MRDVLGDPEVVERHPQREVAKTMWVCEKIVPPIATWLLNYTDIDKEEGLTEEEKRVFVEWDEQFGHLNEEEQPWVASCNCSKHVLYPRKEEVGRGHVVVIENGGFNSPILEAVGKKAYKQQEPEWKVHHHPEEGLAEYVEYKVRSGVGQREDYKGWKDLINKKVMWPVDKEVHTLPQGAQGMQKMKDTKKDFAFVKEFRGLHNWVGVCKQLYKHRRDIYLQNNGFVVAPKSEEAILRRHEDYHAERLLVVNRRLPYIYGIWKAKKEDIRWIR